MVCSNETLKASIDDLKTAVQGNTAEQQETRSALDRLVATFDTWRETRCDEHHSKIYELDEKVSGHEANLNRTMGKFAGILGTIMILMQLAGLLFTYLRIAPMMAGG